jgi:LPXTG-site transpeptidase (sortase) family protein
VVFTINVFNNGNEAATNVILTDEVPSFLDIISVVVNPAGPAVNISSQTITINFGTVEPTDAWTVTVTTVVNRSATPPGAANQVGISADADDDPDNNVDSASLIIFTGIPETGFAPGRVTGLSAQPERKRYAEDSELRLEVPSLELEAAIVGVPLLEDGWDVQWLGDRAGYLNGTAFPTWQGNSVITGHVTLQDGQPGPFAGIKRLSFGDQVILHAWGMRYLYEVRELNYLSAQDGAAFEHQDHAWVTLVTCHSYDQVTGTYRWRVAVGAVLVAVETEGDASSATHRLPTTFIQVDPRY